MTKNYIGITGIKNMEELENTIDIFHKYGFPNDDFQMMIGILISPRNLDITWEKSRYPLIENINPMIKRMEKEKDCFSTLHLDQKNTSDWVLSLKRIMEIIGVFPRGFQLNVKHPSVMDLISYQSFKNNNTFKTILQYCNDFISETNLYNLLKNRNLISEYMNYTDYILIDPSRGRGMVLDMDISLKHYSILKNLNENIKIGFAGGLNPQNIITYANKLKNNFPNLDFSLDIESGVRDNEDQYSVELFDLYLKNLHHQFYGKN